MPPTTGAGFETMLRRADAVIFVAGSAATSLEENKSAWESVIGILSALGIDPEKVPMVCQYTDEDLPGGRDLETLKGAINIGHFVDDAEEAVRTAANKVLSIAFGENVEVQLLRIEPEPRVLPKAKPSFTLLRTNERSALTFANDQDYTVDPVPLMTKRLLKELLDAGVDTLESYAAEIHDPEKQTVHKDYVAFNITAKLAVADLNQSELSAGSPQRGPDMDFESIAVDATKAQGKLLFRLAESVNVILTHEKVKKAIEASGISTLTFFDPKDVAG
jgi:hypothetical protein